MGFILGVIFVACGLLMLIDPKVFYEITEEWKTGGTGEPSDFYLIETRIGGTIITILGFAGIIFTFI